MEKENKHSKYWETICNILEKHFPKGKCKERDKAICMLAFIELALRGVKFDKNGDLIKENK